MRNDTSIIIDKQSGSGKVLADTLDLYKNVLKSKGVEQLLKIIQEISESYPNFAIIYNVNNLILNKLKYIKSSVSLIDFINSLIHKTSEIAHKRLEHFSQSVDLNKNKNILIHSHSSSVIDWLKKTEKNHIGKIYQTISHPMKEGLKSANELNIYGFDIQLVEESSLNLFIYDINIILLGSDVITKDYFINKIGSNYIYLLAREKGIPVYVLADSFKFIDEAELSDSEKQKLLQEKSKPSEEIYETACPNITVHNYYFEKVPLNNVMVVTESGVFPQTEIVKKLKASNNRS